MALFAWIAWATDAQMYFSSDSNGNNRVTMIQEGDEVWIAVLDPDENIDCDLRDKMSPELKIMDPKTGAYIVWKPQGVQTGPITAFDYLEETGADTGLFVSNRPFQIGTRLDYETPETQTHVVDHSVPNPQDFQFGCFLYGPDGVRGGLTYVDFLSSPGFGDLLFVPIEDIPFVDIGGLEELPAFFPFPAEREVGSYLLGRFENMDTLVGLYQDPNDASDVAVTMGKIIDTEAVISWDREVYKDANESATITVADPDENLNCNRVEWVPVFIIVNPGSWELVMTNGPTNFCELKLTGGVNEAGVVRNDPIRWYNIYHNGEDWNNFPDGTYLLQYATENNGTLFDTTRDDGLCRVMFYAQETGANTGVFQLNLNSILDDLGFDSLRPRDVLAAYYLDPNDFDDFKFATAYIEEHQHSATRFTDAERREKELFWIGRDPVYVEVVDTNANVDPCCPEQVVVHICDPHWEDDAEWPILDETSSNSPIFFTNAGMVLRPVWDAMGMGELAFPGGFQLVLNNWKLEVFNEDSIYVRYNDRVVRPMPAPEKTCIPATGNSPNDTVYCAITYVNSGDEAVLMTIVDDYDQDHGTVSNVTGTLHFAPGTDDGDTITWGPATVPAGEGGIVTYDYTLAGLTAFPVGTSEVTNTATIDGLELSATIEVKRPGLPEPTGDGRLIVIADDWPLGNYYDRAGSDSETFLLNSLDWLTEHISGGKNTVLIDKGYEGHGGGPNSLQALKDGLTNNGYVWEMVPTNEWTPALLQNFAVAILERGPGGYAANLATYFNAGYGVLVVGGINADPQQNVFLEDFNIHFQPHQGMMGDLAINDFVPHPVTQGVDTLYTMNPTPITVLGPGPVVLCQQYDDPDLQPGDPDTIIWLVVLELPLP